MRYNVAQPAPCMVSGCKNTIPVWRMSSICEACEAASLALTKDDLPSITEQARANELLATGSACQLLSFDDTNEEQNP